MTSNYGGSFAQKLIDQGRFDEAIESAAKDIARDADDPEPLVDRATALVGLSRYGEAVADLEQALKLDEEAQVLETDFVDDTFFAAILGDARAIQAQSPSDAVARLTRYRDVFPRGRHLRDLDRHAAQLRGERDDSPIVKEHDV
jgi:tetratricopeptide (TPR) repeat protein